MEYLCRWQHLLQLCKFWDSIATVQVVLSVTVVGGSFSCNPACECFCFNYSVRVSAALMRVTVSASNMWVTSFIVFMQVGVSVTIMQLVLPAAHNFLHCKMQVTVSVHRWHFQITILYFFPWLPLLKTLYQVCILLLL